MNTQLFRNYIDGRLSAAETVHLKHLLTHDETAQRDFARYVLEEGLLVESAGMLAEELLQAEPTPVEGRVTDRRFIPLKRWWPLAIAASVAILAGVWWLQPAASLAVRVAEVRGEVSGFRVQGGEGSGFRFQGR
jgi:anti-sigma factor RsiW